MYIRDYIKGVITLTEDEAKRVAKQIIEAARQMAERIMQIFRNIYDTVKKFLDIVDNTSLAPDRYAPKPITKVTALKSQIYYRPVRQVARSRC